MRCQCNNVLFNHLKCMSHSCFGDVLCVCVSKIQAVENSNNHVSTYVGVHTLG
eukprot:m.278003 g.278003  ORF g.278003 m.278003 type:complete len:53 (-) comp15735_c0_seq4:652-810(-)